MEQIVNDGSSHWRLVSCGRKNGLRISILHVCVMAEPCLDLL